MNKEMMNPSKDHLLEAARDHLEKTEKELRREMKEIQNSETNETKSSMGDKYETGRELIMQEKSKLAERLQSVNDHRRALNIIDASKKCLQIAEGAVFELNKKIYFISAPLGELYVDGRSVFYLSMRAPLLKELSGKKQGDEIFFNREKMKIEKVY
ncbi:MAG: hypothetical protein AAF789_08060 [Bacteroidota bacterium]